MNLTKLLLSILIFLALPACRESKTDEITRLVKEWQGKEIVFPKNMTFTLYGKDTVEYKISSTQHKILMYVDSFGCTSCKLQLSKWKEFIHSVDSAYNYSLPVIIVFNPKDLDEIQYLLRKNKFGYPICIDKEDELNRTNRFPSDSKFQTFLLNEKNQVVGIGNPIHSIGIKEFYLKTVTGKAALSTQQKTTFQIDSTYIDMGSFPKNEQRIARFILKNTGKSPLVILDSSTTCGCAATQYDLHPAATGDSLIVTVTYTPKDTGYFEEWITIKCNANPQTVKLSVRGTVL